ncbi:hypothetical protein FRB94_003538 [Tulasnella sp. JGI-2019a]|nr:hypothetical protein FRB93_001107 [Tulasnella sp. JGI-2019a]KAG9002855.1 hypothetical protein FRB94_003538 [Tulasnella sp. JGI-2019a]KAG9026151.1 hypothetical protein FRB95_009358 [Tulasnella sp. JGI-2019a]
MVLYVCGYILSLPTARAWAKYRGIDITAKQDELVPNWIQRALRYDGKKGTTLPVFAPAYDDPTRMEGHCIFMTFTIEVPKTTL